MKTKAIVATLLVAAAASAEAYFASPYPRKAVSPDESGAWIAINDTVWPRNGSSSVLGPRYPRPDRFPNFLKCRPTKS